MNKWLSLLFAVISVQSVYASEGALKVAPPPTPTLVLANHQIVVGKPASPRDVKKTNSPRCNDLKKIVAGQVLPHKLIVRAESELKAETELKLNVQASNGADKYPSPLKITKSISGSSLPSPLRDDPDTTEETEIEENITQAPPIISRRNTISS
jgi:hypothetical protein